MPKVIDWLYARTSCETCKKANNYLKPTGVTVKTTVNATKDKIDEEKALPLLDGIDKLIAVRGKKVETLDLKKNRPSDAEILALIIGPTGNLRAPTAKVGKTMVVGFNPEAYDLVFG